MGLLDKLWDDVMAGPVPHQDYGFGKLRKINTINIKGEGEGEGSKGFQRSLSMPTGPETPTSLPMTPTTPSPKARKENVWRSVFNPGSNLATKGIGGAVFDKPHPKSPTVYDWLYSGETKSEHRGG